MLVPRSALAVDLPTIENGSLLTTVGIIAVAALCLWIIQKVVVKIITVAVLVALAVLIWTQRTSLQDCAGKVRDRIEQGIDADTKTTCTFFGQDVTV